MRKALVCTLICALIGASHAWAGTDTMTLAADARLKRSGLLDFAMPRFALKTGVRVKIRTGDATTLGQMAGDGTTDAMLVPQTVANTLSASGTVKRLRAAFHSKDAEHGGSFFVAVPKGADAPDLGNRFAAWLLSDAGQGTIAQFSEQAKVGYLPGSTGPEAAPKAELPDGDPERGAKLALHHCGRCHVVSERNKHGGIGSTPSFGALRAEPDWLNKFRNFYIANPHRSFTQVKGITPPFDPMKPPHIAPMRLTQDDLADIVAYVHSIKPKDLGDPIVAR